MQVCVEGDFGFSPSIIFLALDCESCFKNFFIFIYKSLVIHTWTEDGDEEEFTSVVVGNEKRKKTIFKKNVRANGCTGQQQQRP